MTAATICGKFTADVIGAGAHLAAMLVTPDLRIAQASDRDVCGAPRLRIAASATRCNAQRHRRRAALRNGSTARSSASSSPERRMLGRAGMATLGLRLVDAR
jgi:hypothetical protein